MGTVFNKEEMLVLLQDFHRLTGLRTVVFDTYGHGYPLLPAGAACLLQAGARRAGMGHRLPSVRPKRLPQRHAAERDGHLHLPRRLIEVITPILIDGAAVGFLLLSHIVQGADEAAEWAVAKERCAPYGIDEAALHSAYDALPRTPYPTLKSASDLLALAASALYQQGLARLNPGSSEARLGQYLSDHLAEELTSEKICRALSLSRTGLYYLSRQTYGCGINEQITRLRVQRAMELLATTSLSNVEISRLTGFSDYNYFYRVFRRQTGLTPRRYRTSMVADT